MKDSEFHLLERITDAFAALDEDLRFVFVNHQAAHILERDRLDLLGRQIWAEFPSLVGEPFFDACTQAMAQQSPAQIERYSSRLDRWIENRIYPSPDGLAILFTDVTARRRADEALRAAAIRLETLIASLQAGVIVEDDHGEVVLANQTFCDMFDLDASPGALTGANMVLVAQRTGQLFPNSEGFIHRALELRQRQRPVQAEELRLADGRIWERDYVPVFPDDGDGYGVHLWLFRDVTERRKTEQQIKDAAVVLESQKAELERANAELERANKRLEELATTDGLTGLLNQRVFGERLGEEFRRSRRYEEPLSLIILDVDRFKTYNDSFGHLAGNTVLRELAGVLQDHARDTDLVARFGGEEFALILPHTFVGEAAALTQRLQSAVEGRIWSAQYPITASFGVCALTPAMDRPEAIIACADAAMYRAKAGGRNRVVVAWDC